MDEGNESNYVFLRGIVDSDPVERVSGLHFFTLVEKRSFYRKEYVDYHPCMCGERYYKTIGAGDEVRVKGRLRSRRKEVNGRYFDNATVSVFQLNVVETASERLDREVNREQRIKEIGGTVPEENRELFPLAEVDEAKLAENVDDAKKPYSMLDEEDIPF